MINIVSRCCENVSPKYVGCMDRGIPHGQEHKISRPSASLIITRTQFTFKKN